MKNTLLRSVLIITSLSILQSAFAGDNEAVQVEYTDMPPKIDGHPDKLWNDTPWMKIDQLILGEQPSPEDFSGAFKLRWDEEYLYLLAKIQDDVLSDAYPDPKVHYWDDDSLEIFLDPDASGGDHLFSYNAYAYHLALDGNAVDLGSKEGDIVLLNDHVDSQWTRSDLPPYEIFWEVRIKFYSDKWETLKEKSRMTLSNGHTFGFMLAWCDADGKGSREHFVGSTLITPINGSKDLGYKTADVFSEMVLVK